MLKASSMQGDAAQAALQPHDARSTSHTRSQSEQHFEFPEDFSLDDYFGQAWRMIPGDRRRHRIRLRFDAAMADTVAGAVWHRTQQKELDDDGGVTLSFEIDGLDEIVWWVLGYGPHCVVEEPTELRDRVAELADATARRYVR